MLITQAFNDFVKAEDLRGQNVRVIIDRVELKEVNDNGKMVTKPVLYFRGKGRGLVLNKTNCNTIVELYGEETDDWTGQEIVLYSKQVEFQGKSVPGIRVRGVQTAEHTREIVPPAHVIAQRPNGGGRNAQPLRRELDDEIPF